MDGVRVLDLTRSFPGGYATLLLADMGADVLKVEAPGSGDPLRSSPGPGPAPAHIGLNRGKRSMTLDTRDKAGLAVLERLVTVADVLVESARKGSMEAAGFGYPQAATVNPRLVWATLSGFGADGPYADRPGHDITFLGQSGYLAAMAEDLPWMPQTMVSVPSRRPHGCLRHRLGTGRGGADRLRVRDRRLDQRRLHLDALGNADPVAVRWRGDGMDGRS